MADKNPKSQKNPKDARMVPFREVIVKCKKCGGTKTGMMQVPPGTYQWECGLCLEKTPHAVREVSK